MNTRISYKPIKLVRWLAVATPVALLALAACGAEATNPSVASTRGATNAEVKPAPIEVPLSQFSIPSTLAEGRNPFFPDSTATIKTPSVISTNAQTKVVSVALVLQGISGTGSKRFALINGRTFEVNEEGDVTVGRGKVHVHCVAIREDGVTVEVEGIRQELRLRPGL